jgi:7SK snRNA methylphosphate capping enzyme
VCLRRTASSQCASLTAPKLAQSLGAHRVVGVDIDATLVSLAWKRRRTVWSLQEPLHEDNITQLDGKREGYDQTYPSNGKRKRSPLLASKLLLLPPLSEAPRKDYFPTAFEHMFGPLPVPPAVTQPTEERNLDQFPHNVMFRAADWAKDGIAEDVDGWDVVLA